MCWGERLDSLNDKEFVWRYKVTKERYAWLCDQLRTQLAPRWNPIIASRDPAKRHHNDALSVELKLSMTLRFMAGGAVADIMDLHGVLSRETFYYTHSHTLGALDRVLRWPGDIVNDKLLWGEVSKGFSRFTAGIMHGCIGAIDGIAIKIVRPTEVPNPARYYCRKGFYALNVQAICDSDCRFLWVAARNPGSTHDSVAYEGTNLAMRIGDNIGSEGWWINGDEAYSSCPNIVTPFPGQRIEKIKDDFNFWLSNSRIRIEMAFGSLVSRWGIFWRPIRLSVATVAKLVAVAMRINNLCLDDRTTAKPRTVQDRYGDRTARYVDGASMANYNQDAPDGPFVYFISELAEQHTNSATTAQTQVTRALRDTMAYRLQDNHYERPARSTNSRRI